MRCGGLGELGANSVDWKRKPLATKRADHKNAVMAILDIMKNEGSTNRNKTTNLKLKWMQGIR